MSGRPSYLPARPALYNAQAGPSRPPPPPPNGPYSNAWPTYPSPAQPYWPNHAYAAPNISGGYQPYYPAAPGPPSFAQQLFPSHASLAYPHPQAGYGAYPAYGTAAYPAVHTPTEAGPSKRARLDLQTLPARPHAVPSGSSNAWRNCVVVGCSFVGPEDKVAEHEGDRHLIFPHGKPVERSEEEERYAKHKEPAPAIQGTGITLQTEEDIAKWIAERKAKWPSAQRQAQQETERQAAIARGEDPGRGRGNKRGRGGRRGGAAAAAEDWGREVVESPARGGRGRGQERGRGGRGRGEVRGSGRGRGGQGQRSEHGHEPPQGGVEYPAVVTALVDQAVKPVAAQTSGLAGLGEYSSASGSDDGSSDSGSDSSDTSDSSDSADTAADGEGPEATPLEAEATVGPIKPICRFFAKTGRCKHGDRCKFLHSRPEGEGAVQGQAPVQRTKPNMPPAKKANLFERPSMLAALLDVPIQITLSQLTQTIRFLVANDMLQGVEAQPGEAEERERERNKIVEVHVAAEAGDTPHLPPPAVQTPPALHPETGLAELAVAAHEEA